ncbi:MAG: hypothetical protein WCT07_00635 [Candidatus Paceibacterota bacterium]|jgi:hypothetical protein
MNFFTNKIVKDFYWSLVFILSMYAIINNPITHPKPQQTPGDWSIQLIQHPLLLGLAGHNYLVLSDQDGEIVSELHGLATDSETGKWKYIGADKTDKLQVWKFDGARSYLREKNYPGIILNQGNYSQVIDLWNKALSCKNEINQKYIPYPPLGLSFNGDTENSNSAAYTLALCIGLDVKHIGLFTPGSKNNLLDSN